MWSLRILVAMGVFVFIKCSPVPSPVSQPNQQYFLAPFEPQFRPQSNVPQGAIQKRQSGPYNPYAQGQGGSGFGGGSYDRPPPPTGGGGGGFPSGGGRGCRRIGGNGDVYRFQCDDAGVSTLKYEHILWLAGSGGGAPAVEIVVPNYRVEEIIKAGFKGGSSGGKQPINILLQKPQKNVVAEVDVQNPGAVEPVVNVQYEGPTNTKVHYPNDQAYRPLSGPILPPPRF